MTVDRHPAVADALSAARHAPEGPQVAAFFDLGGTLLAEPEGPAQTEVEFATRTKEYLSEWAGQPEEDLLKASARKWRKGGAAALSYETWEIVKAHQRRGHTVVLLSSATRDRAVPAAAEYDIEHVISTEPEVRNDGTLTGGIEGRPVYGPAKLAAAKAFATDHDIDLAQSFAYADGAEDVGLLDAVGHPVAVNPDPRMLDLAGGRSWPTFNTTDRAADALGVARTFASYGGFFAATGLGITAGLLGRRRRAGVDVWTRTFGAISPHLSGIKVEVQGEEHARSHRPAVFTLNHQSHLVDAIVMFNVLKDGFTVVAKKEARNIPVLGQSLWLADWAFVDRVGDKKQARAAIQDATDKLKEGTSVIIAPEGTRSLGPKPGPFKKGAFFMAREAGVPIVPVVMRNAGELMWRNGKALKGGTVQVVVHPPIWCDWDDEIFNERVDAVRQLYVDTLEAWPGG